VIRRIGALLGVSVLILLFAFSLQQARLKGLKGDGIEYLLYAHAFVSHASPEIREPDIDAVSKYLRENKIDKKLDAHILGAGLPLRGDSTHDSRGFVRSGDGAIYTIHFWFYPAFVAPVYKLTEWLRVQPVIAFTIANWLFVLIAFAYLVRWWRGSCFEKWLLSSLFLLVGTTYYIWWSHPEVFTASLVLLALMMLDDRRYGLGALVGGLATTQNPPVIFLVCFIALCGTVEIWQSSGADRSIGTLLRKGCLRLVAFFFAFLLALLPVAFFYQSLGVLNPIQATGFTDHLLVSPGRLYSLFFDLNQGMIVGTPGVAFGLAAVLLVLCASAFGGRSRKFDIVMGNGALIAGVVLSVVMALPALTTTNWNHGQAVFTRYAYWLAIPITFGFVRSIGALGEKTRTCIASVALLLQLLTVAYYGVWGTNWRGSYMSFKPAAAFVLDHYPGLYNPVPEIFIERLRSVEVSSSSNATRAQTYVYPNVGRVTKALATEDRAAHISRLCKTAKVHHVEGGWAYLSFAKDETCAGESLQ
jgi:hypothetical protein